MAMQMEEKRWETVAEMQPDEELQRCPKWHPAAIDNLVIAEPSAQIFPDKQVSYPKERKILINPNVALSNSSSNGVFVLLFSKVHTVFMQSCIPSESTPETQEAILA